MRFREIKDTLGPRTTSIILGILDQSFNDGIKNLTVSEIIEKMCQNEGISYDDQETETSFKQLVSANVSYNFKSNKIYRSKARKDGKAAYFTRPIPTDSTPSDTTKRSYNKRPPATADEIYKAIKDQSLEELIETMKIAKEVLNTRLRDLKEQQQIIEQAITNLQD